MSASVPAVHVRQFKGRSDPVARARANRHVVDHHCEGRAVTKYREVVAGRDLVIPKLVREFHARRIFGTHHANRFDAGHINEQQALLKDKFVRVHDKGLSRCKGLSVRSLRRMPARFVGNRAILRGLGGPSSPRRRCVGIGAFTSSGRERFAAQHLELI